MTFNELVGEICNRTGEKPSQVKHLVRAWIRDGLLPKPKIVPVPGRRGTRGAYSRETLIAYLVIKTLRPRGKGITCSVKEYKKATTPMLYIKKRELCLRLNTKTLGGIMPMLWGGDRGNECSIDPELKDLYEIATGHVTAVWEEVALTVNGG